MLIFELDLKSTMKNHTFSVLFTRFTAKVFTIAVVVVCCLTACQPGAEAPERPVSPWAFRSVLDKKPRMLTLALDSACYVAYDLATCRLYKAWKGGVRMEGTAYTDQKNVQPTSWGTAYISNSDFQWVAERNGQVDKFRMNSKGYYFTNNQVNLKYDMILSTGDTIRIEERPEFIRGENGEPGLERTYTLSRVPDDVVVSVQTRDKKQVLEHNSVTVSAEYFSKLPKQSPPKPEE